MALQPINETFRYYVKSDYEASNEDVHIVARISTVNQFEKLLLKYFKEKFDNWKRIDEAFSKAISKI